MSSRRAGLRVKLRTGGAVAAAFPSEQVLADAVAACLDAGVAFKLTAGLHHAVRHRDAPTGFEQHGFLNVLAAVTSAGDLAGTLAERDAAVLVERISRLTPDDVARARDRFASFGTCSTSEPLADLRSLGLIAAEGP